MLSFDKMRMKKQSCYFKKFIILFTYFIFKYVS